MRVSHSGSDSVYIRDYSKIMIYLLKIIDLLF